MPDASGHPNPPKPISPPPLPAGGMPPRVIPSITFPPATPAAVVPPVTPEPAAPATPPIIQPQLPLQTPPPAPAAGTTPEVKPEPVAEPEKKPEAVADRPKPKGMSFPKFAMLSKKPRELLSRQRKREAAEASTSPTVSAPAPTPEIGAEPKPENKLPAPATTPQSIQKVVLDPHHKGGSNKSRTVPEKLPHPRELSETPAVPGAAPTSPVTTPAPSSAPVTPTELPKKEVHRARPAWLRILVAVTLRVLVLGVIVGLGFYSYYQLRETRLEGFVNLPPGFQLKRVCLVRDFREDVFNLAEELAMARAPIRSDIDQLESVVTRSKADVAGRDERLRLLREEVEKADKDILGVMKEATDAGNKVWAGPGVALDAEYAQKKDEFHKRIVERATQLNIKYVDNTDFHDPEVWVNAFRLALYDVPKGINPSAEREWAEKQLNAWKKYVETYQQSTAAIKKQVDDIQTSPQGRIGEINQRIADLNQRITETEQEIAPIRAELKDGQTALDKLKTEQAGMEAPFYKQVLEAPEGSLVLKLNFVPETNTFSWREINRDSQFPPGQYYLWVSALTKDGQEYWSFVSINLYQYCTTQVIIQPGALVSVQTILHSGTGTK